MVRPRIVLNVTLASTRVLLVPSCAIVIGAIVVGACARSSTYPDPAREVRHIIPWGPGGATDVAMRGIAQYLEASLGIPVVTENVAGGLSAVGLLHVKGAPPDGYTIGTMTYDVLTLEFQGLAPVSWRDFEPIGMATDHATVLIGPAGRWTGVQAFEASAKAEPGSIKVGNLGTGGIWHQHAVAMERALGVTLAHVPYEAGSGAQIAALLGGEVDAIVTSLPAAVPHLGAGALAALGVMSLDRDQLCQTSRRSANSATTSCWEGFASSSRRSALRSRSSPGSSVRSSRRPTTRRSRRGRTRRPWARTGATGTRRERTSRRWPPRWNDSSTNSI